jgi:hypothetical protein
MLTADQRKELEAIEHDIRVADEPCNVTQSQLHEWADRIAAVLANGMEE